MADNFGFNFDFNFDLTPNVTDQGHIGPGNAAEQFDLGVFSNGSEADQQALIEFETLLNSQTESWGTFYDHDFPLGPLSNDSQANSGFATTTPTAPASQAPSVVSERENYPPVTSHSAMSDTTSSSAKKRPAETPSSPAAFAVNDDDDVPARARKARRTSSSKSVTENSQPGEANTLYSAKKSTREWLKVVDRILGPQYTATYRTWDMDKTKAYKKVARELYGSDEKKYVDSVCSTFNRARDRYRDVRTLNEFTGGGGDPDEQFKRRFEQASQAGHKMTNLSAKLYREFMDSGLYDLFHGRFRSDPTYVRAPGHVITSSQLSPLPEVIELKDDEEDDFPAIADNGDDVVEVNQPGQSLSAAKDSVSKGKTKSAPPSTVAASTSATPLSKQRGVPIPQHQPTPTPRQAAIRSVSEMSGSVSDIMAENTKLLFTFAQTQTKRAEMQDKAARMKWAREILVDKSGTYSADVRKSAENFVMKQFDDVEF